MPIGIVEAVKMTIACRIANNNNSNYNNGKSHALSLTYTVRDGPLEGQFSYWHLLLLLEFRVPLSFVVVLLVLLLMFCICCTATAAFFYFVCIYRSTICTLS